MKKTTGAFLVLAFGILFAGLIALSGFLTMLLGNVILEHFDVRTLDYTASLAIALLATIYGVGINRSSK